MSTEDIEFNLSNPPVGAAEIDFSPDLLSTIDFSELGSGFAGDIGNYGLTPDSLQALLNDSELMAEFAKVYPDAANILQGFPTDAEMRDLSKQAERDTEDGGIMSPGAGGGLGTGVNTGAGAGAGKLNLSDLLKYGLPALGAYASYKSAKDAQKQAAGAKFESRAPVKATKVGGRGVKYSAQGGGIGSLDMAQGGRALPPRYLDGHSDGMADKVPAHIDGKRPAALSDGEFVIPADVVSHLGNGNSNAGAKRLYEMMDRIRSARTGNHKQGKQINPDKFIPR
jgi:hypothetical protein